MEPIDIYRNPCLYDEQAEKSALGCLIEYENTRASIMELTESDFYLDSSKRIFVALRDMYVAHQAIDLVTLFDKCRELYGNDEMMAPMLECARYGITSALMKSYVAILKRTAARRKAIEIMQRGADDLMDMGNDAAAIIEFTRTALRDLAYSNHGWMSMQDMMMATYDYLEKRCRGEEQMITCGVSSIDNAIGGFFAGELTIIGARPAVGKSAFGATVAIGAAKQGIKVCVCSREMSAEQYGQRILSHFSLVDGMKLRKATLEEADWMQLGDALNQACRLPASFIFSVSTVEDLRAEVQKKVDKGECDMLIVDYLQIMRTKQRFDADHLRVAYISKMLKDMTLDLHIPIIALAQVKRFAGGGRAKMPTLEDLKDSGAIEQDADGVIFLHKPEDTEDPYVDSRDYALFNSLKETDLQYMAFGIAKQRQGATGYTNAVFNPSVMRYTAVDRS